MEAGAKRKLRLRTIRCWRDVLGLLADGARLAIAACHPGRAGPAAPGTPTHSSGQAPGFRGWRRCDAARNAGYFFLWKIPFRSGQNSLARLAPALTPMPAVPHSKMDSGLRKLARAPERGDGQLPYALAGIDSATVRLPSGLRAVTVSAITWPVRLKKLPWPRRR